MKELLGKTLGNYYLQRILGQGRMGVVFLANDLALLRPTALKLMAWTLKKGSDQDPVKWFLSEARSVARISHPNVIHIYSIAKHGEYRYIAMEYVEGESVEQALLKNGPFSVDKATDLLIQTSAALEAAHQCGVVHRDVKPANLLLRSDGIVKLSDFGMALSNDADSNLSAAMRVGTPYFNAPETWEGRPASPASDIYSLGVTYFLLLTGKLPFEAKNMEELRWKHIHDPAPDPRKYAPKLPQLCSDIILRCLLKKPNLRYGSAAELGGIAEILREQLRDSRKPQRAPYDLIPDMALRLKQTKYQPAIGAFADVLHFMLDPFGEVDPLNWAYDGKPFSTAFDALNRALAESKRIVMVHGDAGSGKTTLIQRHALQTAGACQAIFLTHPEDEQTFSPLRELCRYAFIDPIRVNILDELEAWLASDAQKNDKRVLIYVDDCLAETTNIEEVKLLAQRIAKTDKCTLVTASNFSTMRKLQSMIADVDAVDVEIPPLRTDEVIAYIRKWILKALSPFAPLLLLSTDACLLTAHGSSGNPAEVNRIVRRMLQVSAVEGTKVISSWEAWNCLEPQRDDSREPTSIPVRPQSWPTPEVTKILNECRLSAGMAPINPITEPFGEGATTDNEGGAQ